MAISFTNFWSNLTSLMVKVICQALPCRSPRAILHTKILKSKLDLSPKKISNVFRSNVKRLSCRGFNVAFIQRGIYHKRHPILSPVQGLPTRLVRWGDSNPWLTSSQSDALTTEPTDPATWSTDVPHYKKINHHYTYRRSYAKFNEACFLSDLVQSPFLTFITLMTQIKQPTPGVTHFLLF